MASLSKEVVVNEWSMIVEKAGDQVEQVFKDTEENIKKSKAPGVDFERTKISTDLLERVAGTGRDFLKVTNEKLPKYEMYIGVREYGVHLDVVWYLVYEPGPLASIINMVLSFFKKNLVFPMSLFDERDLTLYATVVHHSFLQAVENITKGTGQEISKSSKGFLGIS
jgi:hypothetical protein